MFRKRLAVKLFVCFDSNGLRRNESFGCRSNRSLRKRNFEHIVKIKWIHLWIRTLSAKWALSFETLSLCLSAFLSFHLSLLCIGQTHIVMGSILVWHKQFLQVKSWLQNKTKTKIVSFWFCCNLRHLFRIILTCWYSRLAHVFSVIGHVMISLICYYYVLCMFVH